jgi:peptidylprolyl isomerase
MTTPVSRNPKRQRKKEGHQRRREAELAALKRQRRNRQIVRFALVGGLIVAAAAVIALVGNDDDDGGNLADATTTTTVPADSTSTTEAPAIDVENLTCATPENPQTDLTTKPTITPPPEQATDLTCLDHVVGTGEEVPAGATIKAHYVGVLRKDGTQFDASWDRGEPSEFSLDAVIPGWTQGIPGMKVGGRRELTIPPELGYGEQGQPPDIGPNETLIFVVDLEKIG